VPARIKTLSIPECMEGAPLVIKPGRLALLKLIRQNAAAGYRGELEIVKNGASGKGIGP
jgi:hypothetical protein